MISAGNTIRLEIPTSKVDVFALLLLSELCESSFFYNKKITRLQRPQHFFIEEQRGAINLLCLSCFSILWLLAVARCLVLGSVLSHCNATSNGKLPQCAHSSASSFGTCLLLVV